MADAVNHARRNLLFARRPDAPPPIRPPWTTELSVANACTGCGACGEACPEGIISLVHGLPRIDFASGECTFCSECALACPEPVFNQTLAPAFAHSVAANEMCLPRAGVVCRSCGEACPESAIRFTPLLGAPALPEIDGSICTGCGACVGVCPVNAMQIRVDSGGPSD